VYIGRHNQFIMPLCNATFLASILCSHVVVKTRHHRLIGVQNKTVILNA